MRRLFALSLLLCLASCGFSRAQTFNLQTGREPVASLDGLWSFHTGDNPQWANPDFDDSQWPLLRSDRPWTKQGYPDYGGYAWYRFTLQVPDGRKPGDLLLTEIHTGYQVYANGQLIGSVGSTSPTRNAYYAVSPKLYRLPVGSAGPQTIQIALRVWNFKPEVSFYWRAGGPMAPGNEVGDPVLLAKRLHHELDSIALVHVNQYVDSLLGAVVGLTILVLFCFRPEDREYLWFAILLLADAVDAGLGIVRMYGSAPDVLVTVFEIIASTVSLTATLVFLSIVLHLRRSLLWWAVCGAALLSIPLAGLSYFQWLNWNTGEAIWVSLAFPADIWIIAALAICSFRKDISARLLLAPVGLYYGFHLLLHLASVSMTYHWPIKLAEPNLLLLSRPFPFYVMNAVSYIFIVALLIFLVRRFSLARQEETRLATEMEAAHSMQSFLIPATPPRTPGFHVESIYLPASEVGGDFFQILPAVDDQSLLIIVGDVSGKGLKAAMTVSAIVGGLRQITTREPARVLAAINRQLLDELSGGFVTCCAALLTSSNKLTIANAGHLPPYRNGEELKVEAGLPLGLSAASRYEEMVYEFAPGDRLTLISDGVVEAQNARKELFGFERTQQISTQPAAAIAQTVQQFGQEDDITVVAITRTEALDPRTAVNSARSSLATASG
jgi:hypothetical protein